MTDFDLLENEIGQKSINWETVETLMKSIAPSVNDEMDDCGDPSCALALLILGFDHSGEDLVRLVKLFLENGFDPKANDYHNGYSVLSRLAWTTGDHYILDAAKLLINAGAKIDDETFESISWQLGDWTVGDCDYANLITSYCVLADQVMQGEEYQDIECWDFVKRKRLEKVERITITEPETGEQRENYVLWFEGFPLLVNEYTETFVNPYILKKVLDRTDVSNDFSDAIGRKLKRIHYVDAYTVHISFFNNCTLVVGATVQKGKLNTMMLKEKAEIISERIRSLRIRSRIRDSWDIKIYSQDAVFLSTESNDFQITNNDIYGDNYLSINKVTPDFVAEAVEVIAITNGTICGCFYHVKNNNEITGICIECDEGYLYIRSSSSRELELFLSEKRFTVQEFVTCSRFYGESFNSLKKIKSFQLA